MLVLKTAIHETIWGGEKLSSYAGSDNKKIGHLYSLCSEERLETRIMNGAFEGRTVDEWFKENRDKYHLSEYKEFPLIIALVEACDNLSIQVHPDDDMAVSVEGAQYGKNESWFFIEAPQSGDLYNGCLAEGKEEVRKKLESGEMMSIVDRLPVDKGDYVYVEAGTLHAMTAGSFVYEIEENSPWTYRLYDYDRVDDMGRKRSIHVDKGLMALNTSLKSEAKPMGSDWIDERRYRLLYIVNQSRWKNESETVQCFTVLSGTLEADNIRVSKGMTVVLEPGETITGDIREAIIAQPK